MDTKIFDSPWWSYFKLYRGLREKSLRELSEDTGISNPYLSQLENGKIRNPSFKTIMKLLKYYSKDPNWLYEKME